MTYTDTMTEINGIPHNAPLFRGASREVLAEIVECMSSASHHYADDSGKEWGTGHARVTSAAKLINEHNLPFRAIKALHSHTSQLVFLDQIMDAVLEHARGAR